MWHVVLFTGPWHTSFPFQRQAAPFGSFRSQSIPVIQVDVSGLSLPQREKGMVSAELCTDSYWPVALCGKPESHQWDGLVRFLSSLNLRVQVYSIPITTPTPSSPLSYFQADALLTAYYYSLLVQTISNRSSRGLCVYITGILISWPKNFRILLSCQQLGVTSSFLLLLLFVCFCFCFF